MKKKVFEVCETVLIAVLMIIPITLLIECIGDLRIAIDYLAIKYIGGPEVFNTTYGNIFYVIANTISFLAAFGYIVTMPSLSNKDKKD